jgi:Ran GTPase-activating protein (RanGAP) involved in mRNA processing and transport
MGIEGAKHLAGALKFMKELCHLDLAENEIGDQGIKEIINSCKDYSTLEYLDISGNNIGKSSFINENADAICDFLVNNNRLEILRMNWNNIRGHLGEKIIEGLIYCRAIRQVHMNNNLLGVAYDDK